MSLAGTSLLVAQAPADGLNPAEQIGKQLFFETRLSNPQGQSCASC
ncbi:MAG: cytochrome-c peroxidase, partial [Gammaproteobacteria bacterium]|nr:cytochrome-c peroxidase [Gammaproteobacteria bacterium]